MGPRALAGLTRRPAERQSGRLRVRIQRNGLLEALFRRVTSSERGFRASQQHACKIQMSPIRFGVYGPAQLSSCLLAAPELAEHMAESNPRIDMTQVRR